MGLIILAGLGLVGATLTLWPLVHRRRANLRRDADVKSLGDMSNFKIATGDAPSSPISIDMHPTWLRHEREAKPGEPAAHPEPVPPRSSPAQPAPVAPLTRPTLSSAPRITDPFTPKLRNQARDDRLRQRGEARKLRHKPTPPFYSQLANMPVAYGAGARKVGVKDYGITYVTDGGEVTERRMPVRRTYELGGFVYVEAFFLLRGEERTFRADLMKVVTHLATRASILMPNVYVPQR